jgi:hypothetical protein
VWEKDPSVSAFTDLLTAHWTSPFRHLTGFEPAGRPESVALGSGDARAGRLFQPPNLLP